MKQKQKRRFPAATDFLFHIAEFDKFARFEQFVNTHRVTLELYNKYSTLSGCYIYHQV
jgi:hypothetical protein